MTFGLTAHRSPPGSLPAPHPAGLRRHAANQPPAHPKTTSIDECCAITVPDDDLATPPETAQTRQAAASIKNVRSRHNMRVDQESPAKDAFLALPPPRA